MIPMTPSGTRTFRMRSPFDFVHSARVSPMGSGRAATSRTPRAMSSMRDAVNSRRSRIAPSSPEFSTSSRLASRMLFSFASIALAIASSNAFFSSVDSNASLRDAARARSNLSCVERAVVRVAAIRSLFILVRRKIRADLAFQAQCDRPRMPPVHNSDVDSALARQFSGAQFGNHAAATQRTLAVALGFQRRRQLSYHPLQTRLLAAVGNQESIDIGQQQQPVRFDGPGQQRTQLIIVAERAFQFAHRDTVIFVHDGDDAQREQFGNCVLQITIAYRRREG